MDNVRPPYCNTSASATDAAAAVSLISGEKKKEEEEERKRREKGERLSSLEASCQMVTVSASQKT